jgi:hypothetical protein
MLLNEISLIMWSYIPDHAVDLVYEGVCRKILRGTIFFF